jgi:cytochrome P450
MVAGEPDLATWLRAKRQMRRRASQSKRYRRPDATAGETADALARRLVLTDPEFEQDPNPYLARLRDAAAVHHLPRQGCWLAVGYDAVRSVFTNPDDYSSADMVVVDSALMGADDESHRMARRLLAPRFATDAIRSLGIYAEATAERLLAPFVGECEFDVVRELSTPLTALVAGRLLQLDDTPLSKLCAQLEGVPRPSSSQKIAATRPVIEPFVASMPPYAELVGQHDYEHSVAVGLITLLWVAATSSSRTALSESVLRLADRSVRREVQSQPDLLPAFIEESLRLDAGEPPITRRTLRDVILAGVAIPADSPVVLMIGPANRDPARFEDPDGLVLDRPGPRDHLTFAAGPHHCLGARLARAEIKAALTALLRLMPDFELVQPRHMIRRSRAGLARTLEQLVITSG